MKQQGGGTRRHSHEKRAKPRRAPLSHDSIATIEDDGTQVETDKKKTTKRKSGTRRGVSREKRAAAALGEPTPGQAALASFVRATVATGVDGLVNEFEDLRKLTTQTTQAQTAFDANKDRNRYKDVPCVDETRVQLTFPSETTSSESPLYGDYIHANWVDISEGKKYICTQGPTPLTVIDFWRMIWQENVKGIIMLCNVIEQNKPKCEQYWSLGEGNSVTHGPITIRTGSSVTIDPLTTTNLTLHCTSTPQGQVKKVEHVAWNNWPDRGVPNDTSPVLRLLARTKRHSPCVVHCSAGIGRTGTIVGIDMFYTRLTRHHEAIPFKEILLDLRQRRRGAVQVEMQYLFMHKVLIDFALRKKVVRQEEVAGWLAEYQNMFKSRGLV